MQSNSEALFQRKPYQVAPQQRDIDKIAEYTDAARRSYAVWQPGNATTKYLDDFVKEQLQGEAKGAIAVFVAQHKADALPDVGDKITLSATGKDKKQLTLKLLSVHCSAQPYKRARKTALLVARVPNVPASAHS